MCSLDKTFQAEPIPASASFTRVGRSHPASIKRSLEIARAIARMSGLQPKRNASLIAARTNVSGDAGHFQRTDKNNFLI
jgi:hypothetical protein